MLYIEKRARPNLELVTSFLTTRVSQPTEEDWKKLKGRAVVDEWYRNGGNNDLVEFEIYGSIHYRWTKTTLER